MIWYLLKLQLLPYLLRPRRYVESLLDEGIS